GGQVSRRYPGASLGSLLAAVAGSSIRVMKGPNMTHMASGRLPRRDWLQMAAAGLGSLLVPGGRSMPVPSDEIEASEQIGTNWAGNVTYGGTRLYRPET